MKNLVKDLFKRILAASCLIGLIAILLIFAYQPFFSIFVVLSISVFASVATYELINICKTKVDPSKVLLLIFCPLMVISFFISAVSKNFFNIPILLIFLFSIIIFMKNFSSIKNSIVQVSVDFFSLFYISVPLGMLVYILYSTKDVYLIDGRLWVIIILTLSKVSDIFGYFIGKIFGRNTLIKKVSPNKTIEGSLGGAVATVALAFLIQYYLPDSFGSYISAVTVGAITVILSQIGDLCESLLKRDAKIKDSNKIPGIGGILDSLDSLLFTIPFYYIWLG